MPVWRRACMMKRREAHNVRDIRRRTGGDEIADNVEVSHGSVRRAGSELYCTADGKGDEPELEGCLSGIQIWSGARFDRLDKEAWSQ